MNISLLSRALKAGAEGHGLLELKAETKQPVLRGWQRKLVYRAADIAELLINGATGLGMVLAPGYVVVDVDRISKDLVLKPGLTHWMALVARYRMPATYIVETGSHGLQIYLRIARGKLSRRGLLTLVQALYDDGTLTGPRPVSVDDLGIDLRACQGSGAFGYVVVPESDCTSVPSHDGSYRVKQDLPIAQCPEWLERALLAAPLQRRPAGTRAPRKLLKLKPQPTARMKTNLTGKGKKPSASEDACAFFVLARQAGWQLEWIADELVAATSTRTRGHYARITSNADAAWDWAWQDVERMEGKWQNFELGSFAGDDLAMQAHLIKQNIAAGRVSRQLSAAQSEILKAMLTIATTQRKSLTFDASRIDIALMTGLSSPTISRHLKRMEEMGLLVCVKAREHTRSTWRLIVSQRFVDGSKCALPPVAQRVASGPETLPESAVKMCSALGWGLQARDVLRHLLVLGEAETTRKSISESTGVPLKTVGYLLRGWSGLGLVDAGLKVRLLVDATALDDVACTLLEWTGQGQRVLEREVELKAKRLSHADLMDGKLKTEIEAWQKQQAREVAFMI